MATRANSLTDRVTPPGPAGASMPTLPAGDFQVLINGLQHLGYDVHAALAAAGLTEVDAEVPDARVPCDAYGRLVASAQQAKFTPNLAVAIAGQTPVGAYPLLDYLVATSETVGAGIHQLARYFRLVSAPIVIDVHDEVDPVRVEFSANAWPFSIEYTAALLVRHFRDETDDRFAASHVSFCHVPDDVAALEHALGCPVRVQAEWNGVSVPLEAWRLPLRRRDPVLQKVLEKQADDVLSRLPTRRGLALEVQRALARRVTGGDTRMEAVARDFATSGRTLQRRLAGEGVSYQALLDEARKETAGRYLRTSTLSIGEVAYLVGYSEPAPFHRAFKRWFGVTPEGFRKQTR